MFDLLEIYEKLNKTEWITPGSLRQLRLFEYRRTQKEFAALLGVNLSTYVSWEQGRYTPSTPAMALLHVAKYHPETFLKNNKEILKKLSSY